MSKVIAWTGLVASAFLVIGVSAGSQTTRRIVGDPHRGVFVPQDESGCATSSRTFDGTNQYFTGSGNIHTTGAFTVGCWVRSETVAAGVDGIISEDWSTNRDWGLYRSGVTACMYGYSGNVQASKCHGTAISAATWAWLAGAYDGTNTIKVSVNGATYATQAMAGALDNDGGPVIVGAFFSTSFTWAGRLSVCAYFPSELTAGAASQLATIAAGVYDCPTLQATYGATACWNMAGAAGANELDQIGSVDLTQVNSPGSADGPGTGCN